MTIFALIGQWLFGKLPFCSLTGAIVGLVAGAFMGLTLPAIAPPGLTLAGIVEAGLMLAVAGWIAAVVILAFWARYGLGQVAAPAALNAVLTAVLTVWLNSIIKLPALATLVGLAVGILVGLLLCRLCPPPGKERATHGR